MHAYIQEYKGLFAMLHLKTQSPEKKEIEKQISDSLTIWALLEGEVLTNRFQLAQQVDARSEIGHGCVTLLRAIKQNTWQSKCA
jgi:hypothetical protein